MIDFEWEMQEPGWYTSSLGGIVEEVDGWWFYPTNKPDAGCRFATLKAAKAAAEEELPIR